MIAFSIRPGVVDTDMQRDLREIHSAVMEDKDNAKFRDAYQNQTLLKPDQPGNVMARLVLDPDKSLNGQYLRYLSTLYRFRYVLRLSQLGWQRAFEVSIMTGQNGD